MKFVHAPIKKIPILFLKMLVYFGICILIGNFIVLCTFYVHEIGHAFLAIVLNAILNYQIPGIHIGSIWVSAPFPEPFPGIFQIPVWQNTDIYPGIKYPSIGLGGPAAVFFISLIICVWVYYKISSPYKWGIFAIPLVLTIQQVIANTICGTDNFACSPMVFIPCNESIGFFQWATPYFVAITLFVVFCLPLIIEQRNRLFDEYDT